MLLFQWGVHDWGAGEFFTYNITRQFILSEAMTIEDDGCADEDDECADDWIGQLSLTLKYRPLPILKNISAGNLWCGHPDGIPTFLAFIHACDATVQITTLPVAATELTFSNAE